MLALPLLALYLAAPGALADGVAVLDLDSAKGIPDMPAMQEAFSKAVQDQLAQPPISGGKLSDLVLLYACDTTDSACLSQVPASLGVRWLLYG